MKKWVHSTALQMVLATSSALPFAIQAASGGDHGHAVVEEHSHRSPDAPSQMSDLMKHMAGQMKDLSKMMMQGNTDPAVHNQVVHYDGSPVWDDGQRHGGHDEGCGNAKKDGGDEQANG